MRPILSLILLFSLFGCQSGKDKRTANSTERLILEFNPAFAASSVFMIDMNDGKPRMDVKTFNIRYSTPFNYKIIASDSFSVKINPENYRLFKATLDTIDFTHYQNEEEVLDGVSGKITRVNTRSDTTIIPFASPDREQFKIEYQILDAFFQLAESELTEIRHIEYLEALKCYFDYGLPIKKINDAPLEYRFWGNLTKNESKELNGFMNNLPDGKPVIFDCSNFPGMGTMYYELFRKTNTKKDIYYLIKENSNDEDLNQIGNCRIFRSRNELITAIKQR